MESLVKLGNIPSHKICVWVMPLGSGTELQRVWQIVQASINKKRKLNYLYSLYQSNQVKKEKSRQKSKILFLNEEGIKPVSQPTEEGTTGVSQPADVKLIQNQIKSLPIVEFNVLTKCQSVPFYISQYINLTINFKLFEIQLTIGCQIKLNYQ